ncbi:DUF5667 domain-containing protein [Nocardioides sp. SYSU D00038]|uniref:DUF5667 domain-containing protein n=1 Tax=Nocardioides sp. SYSU D00038 TaxID=2812554 RepID=UPI00196829C6|nr:DUF5667 domain-containing protein [Nocardioides sp. SYSU D00038]
MSPVHPARRRAERFDGLVEGDSTRAVDARTQELLELVGALRAVPEPQPRPEFVADLRERLMTAAATELSPQAVTEARLTLPPRSTGQRARDRRIAVALGGFALVGATTSMAVAAQGALPGDTLYPLKRAIENVQTNVRSDDGDKGAALLANARGRLEEVRELSRDGADAGVVADTLDDFSDQATAASDLLLTEYERTGREKGVAQLRSFTSSSIDALSELETDVPDGAREALLNAAEVLFTIDQAAAQACPACTGDGIQEIPPSLLASASTAVTDLGQTLKPPTPEGPADERPVEPVKGPGHATDPSTDEGRPAAPQPGTTPVQQPSGGTTGGSTGGTGGGNAKPTKPTKPVDQLTDSLGDTVDTLGGTVGGVVGGLGQLLGGLTGSLLNPQGQQQGE